MTITKNHRLHTTWGICIGMAVLLFAGSCGMTTAALQNNQSDTYSVDAAPQFIEDFYHTGTADEQKPARLERNYSSYRTERQFAFVSEQMPMGEELAKLSGTLQDDEDGYDDNIGGLDYATPEDAEEFEQYEELFLTNELNEGETFDPSKMTDSIQVFLVSPWSSCYHFPLASCKVNSNFGWRHSRFHSGIDLDLETGDDVVASFDGIVKRADYVSGYGNLVVLKHFNGLETYYAHLSKIAVTVGDTLMAGDKLGLGGSTGRSTGPHLHYEIRYRGAAIDPNYVVDFKKGDIYAEQFYLKKEFFRPVASASTASTGAKYYTVRKGDTLSRIASRNGTTVAKLCKLNGISSKKILKPGMRLRVK